MKAGISYTGNLIYFVTNNRDFYTIKLHPARQGFQLCALALDERLHKAAVYKESMTQRMER